MVAATCPTSALSVPRTTICVGFGVSTVTPAGIWYVTGWLSPSERVRRLLSTWAFNPTPCSSSSFENPAVTPTTMLCTNVRINPCRERAVFESLARATVTTLSATDTPTPTGTRRERDPFGPSTVTTARSSRTVTWSGTAIGCLPTRDMGASSPHPAEQLAPDLLRPGLGVGHDALGRGEDREAQPAVHLRDLLDADVFPQARRGDPGQLGHHRLAVLRVFEVDPQGRPRLRVHDAEVLDEPLALKEVHDRPGHPAVPQIGLLQPRAAGVADLGQAVREGIGLAHYQLAFFTPGISPREASYREQIRHCWNRR